MRVPGQVSGAGSGGATVESPVPSARELELEAALAASQAQVVRAVRRVDTGALGCRLPPRWLVRVASSDELAGMIEGVGVGKNFRAAPVPGRREMPAPMLLLPLLPPQRELVALNHSLCDAADALEGTVNGHGGVADLVLERDQLAAQVSMLSTGCRSRPLGQAHGRMDVT